MDNDICPPITANGVTAHYQSCGCLVWNGKPHVYQVVPDDVVGPIFSKQQAYDWIQAGIRTGAMSRSIGHSLAAQVPHLNLPNAKLPEDEKAVQMSVQHYLR